MSTGKNSIAIITLIDYHDDVDVDDGDDSINNNHIVLDTR